MGVRVRVAPQAAVGLAKAAIGIRLTLQIVRPGSGFDRGRLDISPVVPVSLPVKEITKSPRDLPGMLVKSCFRSVANRCQQHRPFGPEPGQSVLGITEIL